MAHFRSLSKYTTPHNARCARVLALLALPFLALVALFAYTVVFNYFSTPASNFGITHEHVGGDPLEMAFWFTSLASTFLSFYMMELIFRSNDAKLLAQLPIPSLDILALRFKKVFLILILSCFPFAALFAPVFASVPVVATLCLAIWLFGTLLCCTLSTAVLMYAGNASLAHSNNAAFSAQVFSAAPAIALVISLIANLLLKLLAEALLKPNYLDAALTASGIVAAIAAAATFYAVSTFKKQYYAILSNFIDNDMAMLNAGYQFVDDKTLNALRKASSIQSCLRIKYGAQVSRKHTLSRVLIITLSVILAIVSFYAHESLQNINLAALSLVVSAVLAPVWLWLHDDDFSKKLPVPQKIKNRTRLHAALKLSHPNVLALTAAAALPTLFSDQFTGFLYLVLIPLLLYGFTLALTALTNKSPRTSRLLTTALIISSAVACFLW